MTTRPASTAAANAQQPEVKEVWFDPAEKLEPKATLGQQVWVHSPGKVALPTEPMALLCQVHFMRTGETVKYVEYVRAVVRGYKLHIIPTSKDDPKAANVSWSRTSTYVNLSTLLVRAQVAVESGYKELYPCSLEENTPYGPALVIDMTTENKRRAKSSKAKKAQPA